MKYIQNILTKGTGQIDEIKHNAYYNEKINSGIWKEITEKEYDNLQPKEIPIEQTQKTYDELVDEKIRQNYSLSNELAILRQRDTKPNEFNEYNAYCEQCKAEARMEVEQWKK